MEINEVFKDCTVQGNVIKLPTVTLDRSTYLQVKRAMEGIGGKWRGGKTQGFVFSSDPTCLLNKIQTGVKINLKKDYQFFATPSHIADKLVELAEIEEYNLILEPSAGQGAIIEAIHRKYPHNIHYCELMPQNRESLAKLPNITYITDNFLNLPTKATFSQLFHRIIANPPFAKNQDIKHVNAMWNCLAPGGRIVTLISPHYQYSENNMESRFRNWIQDVRANVIPLAPGEFKESGTNVAAVILIINKK